MSRLAGRLLQDAATMLMLLLLQSCCRRFNITLGARCSALSDVTIGKNPSTACVVSTAVRSQFAVMGCGLSQ